jgi:hypothetical protein
MQAMTSSRTRQQHVRRDRRLAKVSGWRRRPKRWGRVGHGSDLPDHVRAGDPGAACVREHRVFALVRGPEPMSPFLGLRDLVCLT